MALHYQADAYMYTTARIRALENGMVGKEKLARLMDVHTAAEAEARLSEMGVTLVRDADGRTDREGTFDAILKEAFALCGKRADRGVSRAHGCGNPGGDGRLHTDRQCAAD